MSEALEPPLTAWDTRVLAALDDAKWRDAWEVARTLHEYDVGAIKQTLNALVDFRYALSSTYYDHRQLWLRWENR